MTRCKIVFDTNILRKNGFEKVANIAQFVQKHFKENMIELSVAEISEKEWKKYMADTIKETEARAVSALKGLKEYGYKEVEIAKRDIGQIVDGLFKEKMIDLRVDIIPVPAIDLPEVIERAVRKKPPFKRGDGDSGFKDTVIFFSLKHDAKETGIKLYIFVTEDKGFTNAEKELVQEFNRDTNSELCISPEATLTDLLDKKFNIGLKVAETRKILEAIIEENKNEFQIFLLTRGKSNTVSYSDDMDGYTFRTFTMQEVWPVDNDMWRVNGFISADINYRRNGIQPINAASVAGISDYEIPEELQITAVPSVLGTDSIIMSPGFAYSPWLKQQERFYMSLTVNTQTKKVKILS